MIEDSQTIEPGKSRHWLDQIEDAEAKFQNWQDAADNIDKSYASLQELRSSRREREFQLFWSNIEVLGQSIYARPPVPVVTPKFKDRRPLYRTASEMLERTCSISFDMADIDQCMIALRDDVSIVGRGAAWVRYESDKDGEQVHYEHVDRKDFLHEPARKWAEVDWVAKRSWLTRQEMRARFKDSADHVEYETRSNEAGSFSKTEKCGVWELWCKSENRVIWVADGTEDTLEEAEPHLKLSGFFPCPKPAFSTVERRSLIPVPDMIFYKDQLEEINSLTRRIHSLADAIKVRGFYAGAGDIGEAIERAISLTDDTQVLVPVPAMAALMQGGGEPIVWLPLDMVANTITGLIELRRQIIEDVYQIVGLSDIMRGSTVASETLGAQQLKQQNGSYRVRDKQNELVRVARDLVRLGAEIMSEEFSRKTLEDMAQMDLPTDAELKEKLKSYEEGAKGELEALMMKAEQMSAQAQQSGQQIDPAAAEQQFQQQQQEVIGKYTDFIEKCRSEVSIDAVMDFLGDEKLRPFALDIETDSTIYPDEMAEKRSRQEFMVAFTNTMAGLMPMFQLGPEAVAVASGIAKFALSPYRVGRDLESLIDDFADQGPAMAEQMQAAQGDGGAEQLAEANAKLAEAEMTKARADVAKVQADTQIKGQQMQMDAGAQVQEMQASMEKERADLQIKATELQLKAREVSVKEAEAAVSEREVAVKEAEAGIKADTAQVDNQAKRLTALNSMNESSDEPPRFEASIESMVQGMRQATLDQATIIASQVSAPKKIIRDPTSGKAIGVKTVSNLNEV